MFHKKKKKKDNIDIEIIASNSEESTKWINRYLPEGIVNILFKQVPNIVHKHKYLKYSIEQ